jgi:predicted DNA-binding protein (MmcQ/YjbR family)
VAKARKLKESSLAPVAAKPSRRAVALRAFIEVMPGAASSVLSMGRSAIPVAVIHKIQGKMFAIQSLRGEEYVILKCDPNLAQALRQQYTGVGHRSHLDKRFWIAVSLDADVPIKEVRRLVGHSYGLVCTGLTKKLQAALELTRYKGTPAGHAPESRSVSSRFRVSADKSRG